MGSIKEIQDALIEGAEIVSGVYQEVEQENFAEIKKYHDHLTTLICRRFNKSHDRDLIEISDLLLSRQYDPEVWEHPIVITALEKSDLDQDYEIGEAADALLNRLPGDSKTQSRDRERRRRHRGSRVFAPQTAPRPPYAEPIIVVQPDEDEEDNRADQRQAEVG